MALDKTKQRITENFVWPGMAKDIQTYISLCAVCQLARRSTQIAPPVDVEIPRMPMHTIAIDFIGPFSATEHGGKYVLTLVDYLTNRAEAYPTRDQSAEEIIRVFETEYFPRHGRPKVLVCDNGQGLGSRAWSDFLKFHRVTLRHSTPYHPQGNGRCERLDKTLKEIILKEVRNRPITWFRVLGPALGAYRAATSRSTGYSPFQLLYARGHDMLFAPFRGTDEAELAYRYGEGADLYESASDNIRNNRRYNKDAQTRRANADELQVGDQVVPDYQHLEMGIWAMK